MPSAPILLASHQTFCENAHLVARHESPSSSVRFKRRQSASGVDGDKAAGTPDDRANTDLAITEPSTSGLGQTGETRPPRNTPRHRRKSMRSKPANSGAPAAYLLCSSEQSRPIIPRTRKLKAGSNPQKHRARKRGPGPALPLLPFPLVRSFASASSPTPSPQCLTATLPHVPRRHHYHRLRHA
jgi:hypothetical protein